jgi:hypothetical protein
MAEHLKVHGADKVIRSLKKVERQLPVEITKQLRVLGRVVLKDAQARFMSIDSNTASKYRVRVRKTGTVTVENPLRKTTGFHPEYGPLQMQRALIPALEHNQAFIVNGLETMIEQTLKAKDLN